MDFITEEFLIEELYASYRKLYENVAIQSNRYLLKYGNVSLKDHIPFKRVKPHMSAVDKLNLDITRHLGLIKSHCIELEEKFRGSIDKYPIELLKRYDNIVSRYLEIAILRVGPISKEFDLDYFNFLYKGQYANKHPDCKKQLNNIIREKVFSIFRAKKTKDTLLEDLCIDEQIASFLDSIDYAIDELKTLDGGHSAIHVFSHGGEVIKADRLQKAKKEHGFLSLNLEEARDYVGYALGDSIYEIGNFALFRLRDVTQEIHGQLKSGYSNPDVHFMYVLGLLHKEGTKAVESSGFGLLKKTDHFTLSDLTFLECFELAHELMPSFASRQRKSREKFMIEQLGAYYHECREYLNSVADQVIMNDMKAKGEGANVLNGHIIDFGSVKWGNPAEDIVKYGISKEYNKQQIFRLANYYIKLRSQHDAEFRDILSAKTTLLSSITPSMNKEYLRFASSMIKRDLANPQSLMKRDMFIAGLEKLIRT